MQPDSTTSAETATRSTATASATAVGAAPAPDLAPTTARRSAKGALRLLLANRLALVGIAVILLWSLGALLVGVLSPYGVAETGAGERLQPPSPEHLFGTDNFGRDVLTRVLAGAQLSLWTGLIAVGLSMLVGVPLGGIAGYVGGWVGSTIMRVMDVLLAFPSLVLAMAIAASLGPGVGSAMIAVGIVGIPEFARIVYGQTMALKQREFVEAGRALGLAPATILLRHIVPNAMAPIVVRAALGMGAAILTAAALSFIGLGAQPPTAEWGVMISDGRGYIVSGDWWLTVFPGIAIASSILAFNLVGDALRDVLDPRLRTTA
ncbi:ABC transporter permease [Agrococcus sp. SGAir0287]|uniref:ABC transporter permease n=1 Tax=Agrococcus sp. SGAir0287 TaxID=2070347 RepID=UPI0010CD0CC0|nr:ABC transporter permease [Agrococcus sp. SGAir0287]QCR20244.1 peptide ABC transporter permease [Agrococcus sp. SGAir0287]